MITKHFFKTVLIFSGMIFIGLLGAFLVSHFYLAPEAVESKADVAKEAPCGIIKDSKPC